MSYAVVLKTRKFKTMVDYWLWYYRNLPRWRTAHEHDRRHVAISKRSGHAMRMERIRKRKEQRLATK